MVSMTRTDSRACARRVSEAVRSFVRAASAVLLCVTLVGCAGVGKPAEPTAEEVQAAKEAEVERQRTAMTEATKKALDDLTHLPAEQALKLVETSGQQTDALDANGSQSAEVMAHVLGKSQFEVREVTMQGDSAEAQVTLRCPDVGAALARAEEHMASDEMRAPLLDAYAAADDGPFARQSLDSLFAAIDASELVPHDLTLTLTHTKDDKWQVAPESMTAVANALFGM